MKKNLIIFILFFLAACSGQSKEELVQEGHQLKTAGNYRGAIVLYKNALEKDVNYLDARLGLANAYLDSGNFDRAEKEFQKLLLQDPPRTELLLKLAAIHIQQKKPEQALLDLDKYHSENSESADSLVLYGRAHGAAGDLDSAEKLFNQALSLDPQAVDPRLNLAKVYLQRNALVKASGYLEDILSLTTENISAYYLLASIRSRQGDRQAALDVYQRLLDADEKQLEALYMAGILQIDLGEIDAAQSSINKIKTLFPGQAEGSRLEGMLLYHQNDFDKAKVALENSLQQQPHLLSYFFLGLSYFGLEQYELALNQFQKALDLSPDFERARILVAMTLLKQKRLDDATIEIQKVLRVSPENAYARNILGSILLAAGKYDEGMAELERATEIDPGLADAHMKRGLFHLAQGQSSSGESDLRKAVQAAPEVMNSRLMLVTHYLRQKNYSEAVQLLEEGMTGAQSDALLYNYLAAAYFSQKKTDQALSALDRAKQMDPDYLTPYFNRASYFASQSDYEQAIAEYRQVLERDHGNLRALLGMAATYKVSGDHEAVEKTYEQVESSGTVRGFVAAARHRIEKKNIDAAYQIVERGLQVHSSAAELIELKGLLSLQKKDFNRAEGAFIQLSGVFPERGNSLLVRLYLMSGQRDKAQQLVDGLLKTDNTLAYPYLLASGLFVADQQEAEARAVLEKGIASVEKPQRLQMQLGQLYERNGELQKAEQIYQRVTQVAPRFAPAYASLGLIYEQRGRKGEALEFYKQAVSFDPRNIAALNNLAYLLADNFGESEKALDYAMRAYRLQPSDPRIMDTLGYILVKNGRSEEAVNLLEKAHELLPEIAAVTLHLAQAKLASGERDEARALLDQVMKTGDDKERKLAEDLLRKS